MSKHCDPFRARPTPAGALRAAAVVLLAVLALPGLAGAQGAGSAAADRGETLDLLAELGDRYEILTLTESWVLRSDAADAPFDVIEVRVGSVAVDGEEMDREALRQLLGDDADLIHSLAEIGSGGAVPEIDAPAERVERRRKVQTDTRISFGSGLTIAEDEIARDVIVFGGALDVGGEIDGNATVIGGSVEVRGEVDGSVTAVGGSVSLGPEAVVEGDVSAFGGVVHRALGARIDGEVTELALGDWEGLEGLEWSFDPWPFDRHRDRLPWSDLVSRIGNTVLLVVAAFLILLVARRSTAAYADRIDREPWKSGLVGLAAQVLFFPVLLVVFIVLMISIVGIPLALLLLPASLLVMLVLLLLGYAGVALFAGRRLGERVGLEWYSPFLALLLGVLLIQGWSILGEAFALLGGPVKLIAFLLILTGFMIKFIAWTVGLGSVLLHSFAPLPARRGAAALPAPSYPQPSYVPPPPAPRQTTVPPIPPPSPPPAEDEEYLEAGGGPPEPGAGKKKRRSEPEDDEAYLDAGGGSGDRGGSAPGDGGGEGS